MSDFITFQKFTSIEAVSDFMQILKDNNIEYELVDNSFAVDITFGGNRQFEKEVKIRQADFSTVNQLLEKLAEENIASIDKNHYLFDFTDEELLEIIQKPDEWSKEDYLLTKNILASKGKNFTQQQLNELNQQRLQHLSAPEKGSSLWIVVGYLSSVLGGLLGIFIGWHLMSFKKVLPNGQRKYVYTKSARMHGQIIFFLGIICLVILFSYKLAKVYS